MDKTDCIPRCVLRRVFQGSVVSKAATGSLYCQSRARLSGSGADASYTEGSFTGPILLWSAQLKSERGSWQEASPDSTDVDSQRKMEERTPTRHKRDKN